MSDRTSASIFGMVFEFLAEQPDARARAFAKRVWRETSGYDFNHYQMDADEALVKLSLADKCRKCGGIDYDGDDDHECEED